MSYRRFLVPVAVALLLCMGAATGQPLPAMVYGDSADERATSLVEGITPGYCMAGWTRSFGVGIPASNVLVIKTDPNGIPLWSVVSLGTADDEAHSMARTSDNRYIITGWTRSFGPGIPNKNVFIAKLDTAGNVIWAWAYGGLADDEAYSIIETWDKGYAVVGFTASYGPPPHPNILLLKVNNMGVLQWCRVYWMFPNHMEDEGRSLTQTPDSGFAITGRAKIINPAFFDPYVLKLDKSGNLQWLRISPGGPVDDEGHSVGIDLQNNIMVAGLTRSFGQSPGVFADIFVTQFGLSGPVTWARTYGWPEGDEMVLDDRSLAPTADAGCAVAGLTTSRGPGIPNPNFLILKIHISGALMWARTHPSPHNPGLGSDVALPMVQLAGLGYAIAGWSNSYNYVGGRDDFHLLVLDAAGNRPVCVEPWEPYVDSMPWTAWETMDSTCRPEAAPMLFERVTVRYAAICEPPGVEERQGIAPGRLELRHRGGRLELVLAASGPVRVELFAVDGRRLATLLDGHCRAGVLRLALPEGLAAGAYVARAAAGGVSVRMKFVRF